MNRVGITVVLAVALTATAACAGGGQVAGSTGSSSTFTFGVATDPGNLDPQRSEQEANTQVAALAYDTPVILTKDRTVEPGIVTKWQSIDPTTWTLTVRTGVTCSDGTTLDAQTVANNLNYVANARNASAYANVTVPTGSVASASGDTVTVKLPAPAPFLIQDLGDLPLVCAQGIADRASLTTGSDGSGPYQVTSVVPGDHIDYTLRKDFTPGLAGDTTASAASLPPKIVVKVVSDATTTANLLLGGQLNAAIVTGTDQKRLQANGLYTIGLSNLSDQIYFNHTASRPTADTSVRKALVMAMNMPQVIAADTAGLGTAATGLLGTPKVCTGNTLVKNLPSHDATGAQNLLTQAGWVAGPGGTRTKAGAPLTIVLAYSSDVTTATSAAQAIAAEWKQLGVNVTLVGKPSDQLTSNILGATVSWDAVVFDLGFATPAQMVPFMSGQGAPKGENFSFIDNATYNSLIAKASTLAGTQGCPDWNAAESALFQNADAVPTGQTPFAYYGKNATFQVSGYDLILPGTIRTR